MYSTGMDQIHIDHHKFQQCHVAQGIPFQVIDIENEDLYPEQDRQQQEEIGDYQRIIRQRESLRHCQAEEYRQSRRDLQDA